MKKIYPFYYEVRFRFLAFDDENNVRIDTHKKVFRNNLPLQNREQAFKAFSDYLDLILSAGKVAVNEQGNYHIIQPSFVNELLNKGKNTKDYFEFEQNIKHFREEISVVIIIEDHLLAKRILDFSENETAGIFEFEIHKVASYLFEEQDIIDNLELVELELYNHFNFDIDAYRETVYHFGLDYAESGEDKESGAKRVILRTPHNWISIDQYRKGNNNIVNEPTSSYSSKNDYSRIIAQGETNQVEFKSSLLYNFKTKSAGINVKYIIAKTICGFLNSQGGVLFVGVRDDGTIQGLNYDYSLFEKQKGPDKIRLELDSLISTFFGLSINPFVAADIIKINGNDVMQIIVEESPRPVFLKNKRDGLQEKELFVRMNASTRQIIDIEDIIDFVFNKTWKR